MLNEFSLLPDVVGYYVTVGLLSLNGFLNAALYGLHSRYHSQASLTAGREAPLTVGFREADVVHVSFTEQEARRTAESAIANKEGEGGNFGTSNNSVENTEI